MSSRSSCAAGLSKENYRQRLTNPAPVGPCAFQSVRSMECESQCPQPGVPNPPRPATSCHCLPSGPAPSRRVRSMCGNGLRQGRKGRLPDVHGRRESPDVLCYTRVIVPDIVALGEVGNPVRIRLKQTAIRLSMRRFLLGAAGLRRWNIRNDIDRAGLTSAEHEHKLKAGSMSTRVCHPVTADFGINHGVVKFQPKGFERPTLADKVPRIRRRQSSRRQPPKPARRRARGTRQAARPSARNRTHARRNPATGHRAAR